MFQESTDGDAPMRDRRARTRTIIDWAWLASLVATFLATCWYLRSFVTDDAWITVRYAENLANGQGFGWNPSGEPTEGFSHPLLFLAETLAYLLGASPLGTARVLGVASGAVLVVAMHLLGPPVVGRGATAVGIALTALYPPLALWAVGGLETLPMALATTVGTLLPATPNCERRRALLGGGVLASLPWLRAEGLVVALAVAVLSEVPRLVRGDRRAAGGVRLALAAGPSVASQTVLELARLAIYGHLLPNPALYKLGAGEPYGVLTKFVDQGEPVLVVAAVGVLAARGRARLLFVPFGVYAFGSIGTLDSVNELSRFFLPTWPQLALLAGATIALASRSLGRMRAPATAAVTLLVLLAALRPINDSRLLRPDPVVHYARCQQGARTKAADWLRGNTAPNSSFSISDAGLVPARSGGRTAVDQLLLTDALIQRVGQLSTRPRVDYVYSRRPGVLVLISRSSERFEGRYLIDRRLTRDSRFAGYELAHVARGDGKRCKHHLFLYRRGRAPSPAD